MTEGVIRLQFKYEERPGQREKKGWGEERREKEILDIF